MLPAHAVEALEKSNQINASHLVNPVIETLYLWRASAQIG